MKHKTLYSLFAALPALLLVIFGAQVQGPKSDDQSSQGLIVKAQVLSTQKDPLAQDGIDVVLQRANLNIFQTALRMTGLDNKLSTDGPFTLFVPTDAKLKTLPQSTMERVMTDPEYLNATLGNHIVKGKLSKENFGSQNIVTLAGNPIKIEQNDQGTWVNGQKIVRSMEYNNGVIYEIDGTILPSQ